jgi:hypothetical protein
VSSIADNVAVVWESEDSYKPIITQTKAYWNFDTFLADLIIQGVRYMRDHPKYSFDIVVGTPEERKAREKTREQEWEEMCDKIVAGFERYLTDDDWGSDMEYLDEPFKLLQKIFPGLWT